MQAKLQPNERQSLRRTLLLLAVLLIGYGLLQAWEHRSSSGPRSLADQLEAVVNILTEVQGAPRL